LRTLLGTCVLACVALSGLLQASFAPAVLTAQEARRRAGDLKSSGVKAYHEGRLSAAAADLKAAIEINLNDFFAHYYLGLAYRDLRRYAEAREVLEVATTLDPRYLQVYVALGDVALGQGDPGESRVWYQKALNRQERYAPALDGLGRLAEALGNEEAAAERYREAIAANRGFAEPYVHLGEMYRRQGRSDDAITLFHEAIKYQPDFAAAFRFLGVAYGELGRRTEAIALLTKAAELEPEEPDHLVALGRLLASWDDRIQAREAFAAAREIASDCPGAYQGLAEMERREGRFDEALALLETALEIPGLDDETRTALLSRHTRYRREKRQFAELHERLSAPALVSVEDEDRDAAMTAESGASTQGPGGEREKAFVRLELARALRDVEDFPGAFEICIDVLEILGRPVELVFECGYYALSAERFTPARELLEEASQRDPSDEYLLIDLGLAYAGLGRLTNAAAAYRQALEVNPDFVEAAIYLGNANLRLGLIDDAEAAYRIALGLAREPQLLDRIQKLLLTIEEIRNPPVDGPASGQGIDLGAEAGRGGVR
jgi:tetratricopeptide (TPR) repeat protein